MKYLLKIALLFFPFWLSGQTFYWSEQPFEFCVEPKQSSGKTSFSDKSNIYGLLVIKGLDVSRIPFPTKYEESGIARTNIDLFLTLKGTNFLKEKANFDILEKEGVLYAYICPIPKESDAGFESNGEWKYVWEKMKSGTNTLTIQSSPEDKGYFSFKEIIIIENSGNYDYERLRDLHNNLESKNFYHQFEELDRDAKSRRAVFEPKYYMSDLKPYHFPTEELSKANLEQLLAKAYQNPQGKYTIKKVYANDFSNDWNIWRNTNTGQIVSKRSSRLVIAYEAPDGWCYYYSYYVVKDFQGGENYGPAYLLPDNINFPGHERRIGCTQIK